MLRPLMDLVGYELNARDGEIGQCEDFLIEDKPWVVRYLVAATGSWLTGRKVLIPLAELKNPNDTDRLIDIDLTREEVESSEPITADPPVSIGIGSPSFLYFGWPSAISNSTLDPLMTPGESLPAAADAAAQKTNKSTLRSVKEMSGYLLYAGEHAFGSVSDFIIDQDIWAVRYLLTRLKTETGNRQIIIPVDSVTGVNWPDLRIEVDISPQRLVDYPPCTMTPRSLDPGSVQQLHHFLAPDEGEAHDATTDIENGSERLL